MQNQINQAPQLSAEDLRRYFSEIPEIAIYLTVGGIAGCILFVVLQAATTNILYGGILLLVGVSCLGSGLVMIFRTTSLRPTDKAYEEWQNAQRGMLFNVALKRLHLGAHYQQGSLHPPIVISGVVRKKTDEAQSYVNIRQRLGKDGQMHHSVHLFVFLFLTKDRLSIFVSDSDALNPTERLQDMHSYYYTHVVGLSLRESRAALSKEVLSLIGLRTGVLRRMHGLTVKFQQLFVNIDNGDKIGVETGSGIEIFNAQGGREFVAFDDFERFDSTFNNLTRLLYDYKQASRPVRP